jgi:hypothetical protein
MRLRLYVIAIVILILHFTGWLKRNNLEWLPAAAVAVFPVVIFPRLTSARMRQPPLNYAFTAQASVVRRSRSGHAS